MTRKEKNQTKSAVPYNELELVNGETHPAPPPKFKNHSKLKYKPFCRSEAKIKITFGIYTLK